MREILFRGKGEDTGGKWVFGGAFDDGYNTYIFDRIALGEGLGNEVDPATVGQYVGLSDRAGEKIFEGDILYLPDCKKDCSGHALIVQYCQSVAQFMGVFARYWRSGVPFDEYEYEFFADGYAQATSLDECDLEVVGNIHDNSELLGGDNE